MKLERINSRTIDGTSSKINTYFDERIVNYAEMIVRQREIAIIGRYVDSQEHYRVSAKDIFKVKSIVDNRREGYDATELVEELMHNNKHLEYMAEWHKGRGGYTSHRIAVLKMLEHVAPEVSRLTGYEIEYFGKAWELRKEKK